MYKYAHVFFMRRESNLHIKWMNTIPYLSFQLQPNAEESTVEKSTTPLHIFYRLDNCTVILGLQTTFSLLEKTNTLESIERAPHYNACNKHVTIISNIEIVGNCNLDNFHARTELEIRWYSS